MQLTPSINCTYVQPGAHSLTFTNFSQPNRGMVEKQDPLIELLTTSFPSSSTSLAKKAQYPISFCSKIWGVVSHALKLFSNVEIFSIPAVGAIEVFKEMDTFNLSNSQLEELQENEYYIAIQVHLKEFFDFLQNKLSELDSQRDIMNSYLEDIVWFNLYVKTHWDKLKKHPLPSSRIHFSLPKIKSGELLKRGKIFLDGNEVFKTEKEHVEVKTKTYPNPIEHRIVNQYNRIVEFLRNYHLNINDLNQATVKNTKECLDHYKSTFEKECKETMEIVNKLFWNYIENVANPLKMFATVSP